MGVGYRLWTTLKVPVGESLDHHTTTLMRLTGCTECLLIPANGIFALGVGHVRRKTMEPGDKSDEPAKMMTTATVDLTPEEWNVLLDLKEELTLEEVCETPWNRRAEAAGVSLERFFEVAETINSKKVIGRFSPFLEHKAAIGRHLESVGIPVSYTNVIWGGRTLMLQGRRGRHSGMPPSCSWR